MSPEEASHHLKAFTATRCERAFRKLTEGHAGLVYSAALRILDGDAALAQDVAQTVFAALAAKPQTVRDGKALAAWLHRAAVGCAVDAVRGESRRRKREQLAIHMTPPLDSDPGSTALWEQASPVIDAAMDSLPETDRQLLVLRFWQRQDLRAIGSGFGMSDNAVQKRITRALEKLRGVLARRGIRGTAATFSAAMLSAAASSPSSAAIAGITSSSLVGANAATAGSTTVFTKLLAMTAKQKIAFTSAAAIVAIGAPAYIQRQQVLKLQAENESLRAASGAVTVSREVRRLQNEVTRLTKEKQSETGSPVVASGRADTTRRTNLPRTALPVTVGTMDSRLSTSFLPAAAPNGDQAGEAGALLDLGGDLETTARAPRGENGKVHWDHSQATGAPDTQTAGDLPTAWAPKQTKSGEQWLQLGYKNAVEIKEINIHETNAAGAVSKVAAVMPDGKEKVLWQGTATARSNSEIIESSIPVPPGINSRQIKVYVDTNRVDSWPEIDAVEMVGTNGSKQWATESTASTSYSENYSPETGAVSDRDVLRTGGTVRR